MHTNKLSGHAPENIDEVKLKHVGKLKYRLRNANVYCSSTGFHFIDYLDPVESINPDIDGSSLSDDEIAYIEKSLQSDKDRFRNQINLIQTHHRLNGAKLLDIGSGGGLFLSFAAKLGAEVTGIELSDTRAYYARKTYGLDIVKRPIEDDYWQSFYGTYDIVTLWDVIEHVNFPHATLGVVSKLLKPGGLLFIDTPCRDSFYHRFGEFTYAISGGRFPTLLNIMYSAHPFGHKQIFSTGEVRQLMHEVGMKVVVLEKFHELSFPISYYLRKLFRSNFIATASAPVVNFVLRLLRIRNKMLVVARRD